jgi:NADPH:quinone reductase
VLFGQSSGKVEPLDPAELAGGGSLFLTRPSLADHARDRLELEWRAGELFGRAMGGGLEVTIHEVLPLAEAAAAHRLLESRATTGKVLLRP